MKLSGRRRGSNDVGKQRGKSALWNDGSVIVLSVTMTYSGKGGPVKKVRIDICRLCYCDAQPTDLKVRDG